MIPCVIIDHSSAIDAFVICHIKQGIYYAPQFTRLASGLGVAALMFAEHLRVYRLGWIGTALHTYMMPFVDERDSGAYFVTHVYLLAGCALPLFLGNVPGSQWIGVLATGVGDAVASLVGVR